MRRLCLYHTENFSAFPSGPAVKAIRKVMSNISKHNAPSATDIRLSLSLRAVCGNAM